MSLVSRALLALLVVAAPASAQTLVPDDDVPGVLIEDGYDLRLGVDGLNYPSNVALGDDRVWITEAGFPGVAPTVKELDLDAGTATTILTPAMLPLGALAPPITDATWHDGELWLSHRQRGANGWYVGALSRFDPDDVVATFTTVVTNLPSTGDHANNTIVFGADGRAYFGQGSATNSAVVGADNDDWVPDAPGFREIAPVAITLNGAAFTTRVPTPIDPEADDQTSPYQPFGTTVPAGTVVPAATPATPQSGIVAGTGAVYSFDPDAADPAATLRLEAWGLRNPFGLAFDTQDPQRLFVSNNGSDVRGQPGDPNDPLDPETFVIRGSRPIAQDYDEVFTLTVGGAVEFFGWPDFMHDPDTKQPLSVDDPLFCDNPTLDAADCPGPIFDEAFRNSLTVEPVFATSGPYVSVVGVAPSTSSAFGFSGDVFAAESGSFSPQTGAFTFTGYKVSRIDRETGAEVDFVVNDGTTPEELFVAESLNKPVSVAFRGDEMLVVDLGVLEPGIDLFQSNTGKVWIVTNTNPTAGEDGASPDGFALRAVWPNPADARATVAFELGEASPVRLAVHDVLGREVATAEAAYGAGTHRLDVDTSALAAGVYVVHLQAGGATRVQRLTVAR